MSEIMFKAWVKGQILKQKAKAKAEAAREAFLEEDGAGIEGIIIAIILILIGIGLCVAFKDQLGFWVNTLIKGVNEDISEVNGDFSITASP